MTSRVILLRTLAVWTIAWPIVTGHHAPACALNRFCAITIRSA